MAFAVAMTVAFTACKKHGGKNDDGEGAVAVVGVMMSQNTATLALNDQPLPLFAIVIPSGATNKTVSWTSSDPTVATVDVGAETALAPAGTTGVVTPVGVGKATITVTTQDGNMAATCVVTVTEPDPLTYDAGVVVGGVKWATRNVGAPGTFAATPADPGMFYQWNSNIGWSATDPLVSSPAGAIWDSAWDGYGAAEWGGISDPCPAGWRVPTIDELTVLANAGSVWTDTPAGRVFGSGNDTIFLPAAGGRYPAGVLGVGGYGMYWSAMLNGATGDSGLFFDGGSAAPGGIDPVIGCTVRCVAE